MDINKYPIFHEPWWLDITAGKNNWGECTVSNQNEIIAKMPWFRKKKFGFTIITHPPLTPTLGPWFKKFKNKDGSIKSFEDKKVANELIDQLPNFNFFRANFSPEITNWLPWYWKGYSQTTRYTYRLKDLTNLNLLWENLRSNIRSDIKKAKKRNINVILDGNLEEFLKLHNMTWSRQGLNTFVDDNIIRKVDAECFKRNCRRIILTQDESGEYHSGAYLVWNKNTTWYLIGGGNPNLRNSGSTSLLIWEAIKFSQVFPKYLTLKDQCTNQ